jgi:hypothetical protein
VSFEPDNIESISERLSKSARPVKAEDIAAEILRQAGDSSVSSIYRSRVISQRTRQYELNSPQKPTVIEVLHTLLGIELKIGNRRLLCPDLATARYLAVFARLGCERIAVPYDITQISSIADELESSWQRVMLLADHHTLERSERLRARVKRRLTEEESARVTEYGAGARYPKFNQKTRQRR